MTKRDDNDRLKAGTLNHDHEADAKVMSRAEVPTLATLADILPDVFATIEGRASGKEKPIATPWNALNNHLRGGLWPGLHLLVGSSGTGKTQMAMQIALKTAQGELAKPKEEQRPVVYVALELGHFDLVCRLLGLLSGEGVYKEEDGKPFKWSELAYPKSTNDEALKSAKTLIARMSGTLTNLPLKIEVGPPMGWNYERLASLAKEQNPSLIVLDYAQIVRGKEEDDTRKVITKLAYMSRAIARDFNTTVLVVSSVARSNYLALSGQGQENPKGESKGEALGKGDPARFIGMGKESGELEYAADCVYALGQEKYEEGEVNRKSWLAVAKGRGFGPGWVPLRFNGARFDEPTTGRLQS